MDLLDDWDWDDELKDKDLLFESDDDLDWSNGNWKYAVDNDFAENLFETSTWNIPSVLNRWQSVLLINGAPY
jgi:hypothetical protein